MYDMLVYLYWFLFSIRRLHTRCALVTGVHTCALPISYNVTGPASRSLRKASRSVDWAISPRQVSSSRIFSVTDSIIPSSRNDRRSRASAIRGHRSRVRNPQAPRNLRRGTDPHPRSTDPFLRLPQFEPTPPGRVEQEIGRAACRERVGP